MTMPANTTQRFQFAETLGFGGMATVYRAFDTIAGLDVAIKVLHPHLRANSVITQHFRQEYTIAQTLEHPNIVRIHSLIDTPQMLALVMELHGTHDLKSHIQHHGKMHHRQVLEIATQILSALEAAHALNITHQDIKPHNILWDTTTSTAKLIDFGLAQFDQNNDSLTPSISLARPESAIATVEYSAPEQFDDFGTDARADLYSLAITLFELLTETLPYRADSAAACIHMHQNAPIADVRVFVRAIPDHFAETLLRAMAKAPEDRFQTATHMREALAGKPSTALTLPPPSTEWDQLKNYHRARLASSQQTSSQNQLSAQLHNEWNVYLPPTPRTTLDTLPSKLQKQHLQAFVRLFQTYAPHYHGDIDINAPSTAAGYHLNKNTGTIVLHYPSLFTKNQALLQRSTNQHNTWSAIPLATGLTPEQAERIRYDLGKDGILAKTFPNANTLNPSPWKRLERWRNLPTPINAITLLLLTAASAAAIYIATTQSIPVLTTITLIFWLLLFARTCFAFALDQFAPAHHFLAPIFFDPSAYHLQFNPKPTFLQDIHATTYLQLRSPRIQNTFERILLTLLELQTTNPDTQNSDNQPHTQNILNQTTTIATRITHLEKQLAHQNYPALFEQLVHLDTQIARSDDTHQTAELIQQKSTLRTLLDQIDTDRQELKSLARQLSTIAQELKT